MQKNLGIVIMPRVQQGIALFLDKGRIAMTTSLVDASLFETYEEAKKVSDEANRLWGGNADLSPFFISKASFTELKEKTDE